MKNSLNRGFTLIELMIVVAIVAILASIAYPAYTSSILKGKRAEGRVAIAELIQQQERYLTQRNTYLEFSNANGVTNPAGVPFKVFSGSTLAGSAYLLSADRCPAGGTATLVLSECVRVVATPVNTDPLAGDLRMTTTGFKDCSGTNPALCWK